jgi:hypothetical protein
MQRTQIKLLKPNQEYIAFVKFKDGTPDKLKIEVAAHPYSTSKSCYYRSDRSEVFLTYVAGNSENTWKKIDDYSYVGDGETPNNHIKFKDEQIKDKYKDYYFQICTVPNHQLSENDFNKLKT